VIQGSAADRAGVQAGDIITGIDDQAITGVQALQEALAAHQPGDRITLKVRRDDGDHSLSVTLGEQTG